MFRAGARAMTDTARCTRPLILINDKDVNRCQRLVVATSIPAN